MAPLADSSLEELLPDAVPPTRCMSGVWRVIDSRSDSLDKFLSHLGVGWMARKVVCNVVVTKTLVHTRAVFRETESSSLGPPRVTDIVLDGLPHEHVEDGKTAVNTATADATTGEVRQCTDMTFLDGAVGQLIDSRVLLDRATIKQVSGARVWRGACSDQ
jgi:hypothetical protein